MVLLVSISLVPAIGTALAVWMSYFLVQAFYRLCLHPLVGFPGPRLAAATYLYEWYYDIYLPGQYTWKLKELHRLYGPIIRLNPDELHVNDPDYLDQIFNNTNGIVEKPFKLANAFGPYPAAIGTINHDLHRVRRAAINPFFSRRSVVELLPCLMPIVEDLCQRFEDAVESGDVLNLKYAYAALTLDNMSEYCFATRADRVKKPDFDKKYIDGIEGFVEVSMLNFHLPSLITPLFTLPDWLSRRISPAMADTVDFREKLGDQVEEIRAGKNNAYKTAGHNTIFHSMLQSDLPPLEMTRGRLRDEAFSLMTAGSGTTAYTLKAITYHIMADKEVHKKLYTALKEAMPERLDQPNLITLEGIPYLTAVISEGLRMSNSVAHRLARVFPQTTLMYDGKAIPPKTQISMTALLIHENEAIFPDPFKFRPDRWLGEGQKLQRYLIPFSRGTRACAGINLAWAELYLIIAVIFRRYEFDVSRVDRKRDVDSVRDIILGANQFGSPGLLVTVKAAS